MSWLGQDDNYITHLIESAITENLVQVQQHQIVIPHTDSDLVVPDQVLQDNTSSFPISIQRVFGADDPFYLGSGSTSTLETPFQTFQDVTTNQDYSPFVIVNPERSVPDNSVPEFEIIEVSGGIQVAENKQVTENKQENVGERRRAENEYFKEFMCKEQNKVVTCTELSQVRSVFNKHLQDETWSVVKKYNLGAKKRSTYRKKDYTLANKGRDKLNTLADKKSGKRNNLANEESDKQNSGTPKHKEAKAEIKLREIQENKYLQDFLELCDKQKENKEESVRHRPVSGRSLRKGHYSKGIESSSSGTRRKNLNSIQDILDFCKETINGNTGLDTEENTDSFPTDCANDKVTDINVPEDSLKEIDADDDSPVLCVHCGLPQADKAELEKHLRTEHCEDDCVEEVHETENEYWRQSKELLIEQKKREAQRKLEEQKLMEEIMQRMLEEENNSPDEESEETAKVQQPKQRKTTRGKRTVRSGGARRNSKVNSKVNKKSSIETSPENKARAKSIGKSDKNEEDASASDDDVEIIEPTIELVVLDSSSEDDNDDKGDKHTNKNNGGNGSCSQNLKQQNIKGGRGTVFKNCSVNLERIEMTGLRIENEKPVLRQKNTKLKTSDNQASMNTLGNVVIKDCKVMLDDQGLSEYKIPSKVTNIRSKRKAVVEKDGIEPPKFESKLRKVAPSSSGQIDMLNIMKYLKNCESQTKDKLLMEKYGIKDVSVNVSKTPTISEAVSKFFSQERNHFKKIDDTLLEFRGELFRPDDQISLVSNRSISPQPSTSSGHSYVPRKRTARKSVRDKALQGNSSLKEPKVMLQNLSSIDIALLKNPHSSYRKSNWLNMFSDENSDSDENAGKDNPFDSLLDNLGTGDNEITEVQNNKKGKGKALCRNGKRSMAVKGKSGSNSSPDPPKQDSADTDLLKKFGITRSIVVLKNDKEKTTSQKKTTPTKTAPKISNVKKNITSHDTKKKTKDKASLKEKKNLVRKTPVSTPSALALMRSIKLKRAPAFLRRKQQKCFGRSLAKPLRQQNNHHESRPRFKKIANAPKGCNNAKKKSDKKFTKIRPKLTIDLTISPKKEISSIDLCKPFTINLTSLDINNVMKLNGKKGKQIDASKVGVESDKVKIEEFMDSEPIIVSDNEVVEDTNDNDQIDESEVNKTEDEEVQMDTDKGNIINDDGNDTDRESEVKEIDKDASKIGTHKRGLEEKEESGSPKKRKKMVTECEENIKSSKHVEASDGQSPENSDKSPDGVTIEIKENEEKQIEDDGKAEVGDKQEKDSECESSENSKIDENVSNNDKDKEEMCSINDSQSEDDRIVDIPESADISENVDNSENVDYSENEETCKVEDNGETCSKKGIKEEVTYKIVRNGRIVDDSLDTDVAMADSKSNADDSRNAEIKSGKDNCSENKTSMANNDSQAATKNPSQVEIIKPIVDKIDTSNSCVTDAGQQEKHVKTIIKGLCVIEDITVIDNHEDENGSNHNESNESSDDKNDASKAKSVDNNEKVVENCVNKKAKKCEKINKVNMANDKSKAGTKCDSCVMDSPPNSVDVVDKQTEDVVGTCYIHQTN